MEVKVIEVQVSDYQLETKPNYQKVGRKVDKSIENGLPNGRYICRAIGKDDHPELSLDELLEIVLTTGTDKYDANRLEVCNEDFQNYDHDIQAGTFEIKNNKIVLDNSYEYHSMFGDKVKKFYENVLYDRGYRVRIDVLIIYKAKEMIIAKRIDPQIERLRPGLEKCLFKFRTPDNKKGALIGIVKILR